MEIIVGREKLHTASDGSFEQPAEPTHRPQIPHTGRRLRESQHFGSLRGGEVFEMPQEDDLTIHLVKMLHGRSEPPLQLVPSGRGGGREFTIGQLLPKVGPGPLAVASGDQ